MKRLSLVIAMLVLFSAGSATAQTKFDETLDEYFAPCENAQSNYEIKSCLYQQFKRADGELNIVWGQLLASVRASDHLPADARKEWKDGLLKAQRAWIQYKETECQIAKPFIYYGGTQADVETISCLLQKTVIRLLGLRGYFNN